MANLTAPEAEILNWIRTIRVEEEDDTFFATTEEDPTLFVSALSFPAAYAAVKSAIIARFRERFQCDEAQIHTIEAGTLAHRKMVVIAIPPGMQLAKS